MYQAKKSSQDSTTFYASIEDTLMQPLARKKGIPSTKKDSPKEDSILQKKPTTLDTLGQLLTIDSSVLDSTSILIDSIRPTTDSTRVQKDTLIKKTQTILISDDSLSMPVQYEAVDSILYDISTMKLYMYGSAQIFYEQYTLKAGRIEFDFNSNVATATYLEDSLGKKTEYPFFDDKNQQFTCDKMEFNFKTKKGKVYQASTKQGDGFLVSEATKFISSNDSLSAENTLFSQNCIYTTCNHSHPHFGIRSSKAKIIPGKMIITGPSYLEIMGSPTPILLPFGFFPITKDRLSGLILSTNIEFSPTLGPGIRDIGFYLNKSEYWDVQLTGDFYMRGSYRAKLLSNYNVRYKANGQLSLGYTRLQTDEIGTPDYNLQKSFNLSWSHRQAQQAHPSQSFSASVNFGSSDFYQNTYNDADNVLNATFNSNISFNKRFTGTPFSLSARLAHSQNTQTQKMTIDFPQLDLRMNRITPFKRKKPVGGQRWYERIGVTYTGSLKNRVTTSDTSFFTKAGFLDALDNMEYNMVHNPGLNISFKVLKYINIQPSVNYTQYWYFYAQNRRFLDQVITDPLNNDTLNYGVVDTVRDYGFYTAHNFSAGLSANTQIYATGTFNLGKLHQLRGTFTPNIGVSWRPDYSAFDDYYYDSVQTDSRYPDNYLTYGRFGFRPPSGKAMNINYSLNALIQAKMHKSKRDSLLKTPYKKVSIIPNLAMSGSYNAAADSLHFSAISLRANSNLFKRINITVSATFDPYAANTENNQRIQRFEFQENSRLVRPTQFSFNAATSLTSNDLIKWFSKDKIKNLPPEHPFNLLKSLRLDYSYRVNQQYIGGVDSTVVVSNQLAVAGLLHLSKNWDITIGRVGYDFDKKRVTYPDFTFSRSLHCWQMGMSWQPERQSWNFFIRVRPSSLGFINVPVKQEFYDAF